MTQLTFLQGAITLETSVLHISMVSSMVAWQDLKFAWLSFFVLLHFSFFSLLFHLIVIERCREIDGRKNYKPIFVPTMARAIMTMRITIPGRTMNRFSLLHHRAFSNLLLSLRKIGSEFVGPWIPRRPPPDRTEAASVEEGGKRR